MGFFFFLYLKLLSDCELLMPVSYYRRRLAAGQFGLTDLELAIDEMVADGIAGAESLNANAILAMLGADGTEGPHESPCDAPGIALISQHYDREAGTGWTETICQEVSKHLAAQYDEGQAVWASPFKELPLYQAWRTAARADRQIEILGLHGFRQFVSQLPDAPAAALGVLLEQAQIPQEKWTDYLIGVALSLPGWSAWAKYQSDRKAKQGEDSSDFVALLAIRLAYEVALSLQLDFQVEPSRWLGSAAPPEPSQDALVRLALLRANEIGFRDRILDGIQHGFKASVEKAPSTRQLAQMVFCIDVRSERIRRKLESSSQEIDTFGFAGFFGLPFEYVRLGDNGGTNQLPVLLDPQFKVYEDIRGGESGKRPWGAIRRRAAIRGLRYYWKAFQASAVSSFAFVETTGLLYVGKLAGRLLGRPMTPARKDGLFGHDAARLGPSFRNLRRQGISTPQWIDMAESILSGIGITRDFAKLVVLCGHHCSTENNPLQAGLDCGACGGHSGEANARFAAMLLNRADVRAGLSERGIEIPDTTHFLAATHNTTTDELHYHDVDLLPDASAGFFAELQELSLDASRKTRQERLSLLPGSSDRSLVRRSVDWSEVRPEWGLTGNAAFVIGPRSLTDSFSLRGESFLHSYDFRSDPEGLQLEKIMTAPLVVTNWINMQYYASTVDPSHFGSGNKTIHNVVGMFGVVSGNGGDLTTGLPWESIHNGRQYQHDPKRLLTVIEAPRTSVERVLATHAHVRDLFVNGWLNLVVIEDKQFFRYSENSSWEQLDIGLPTGELQTT